MVDFYFLTGTLEGVCTCVRVHTIPCSYLLGSSTAREEVAIIVAMEGDVEDVGVTVEGLLGAVAMVNVLQ